MFGTSTNMTNCPSTAFSYMVASMGRCKVNDAVIMITFPDFQGRLCG